MSSVPGEVAQDRRKECKGSLPFFPGEPPSAVALLPGGGQTSSTDVQGPYPQLRAEAGAFSGELNFGDRLSRAGREREG